MTLATPPDWFVEAFDRALRKDRHGDGPRVLWAALRPRLKANPMDEEIEWHPEYTKLMAERKRNSHATVPGRMTFTILKRGAK